MRRDNVQKQYEKYLLSTDTIKVIDGVNFYKVVYVSVLKLCGKDIISTILPYKMFEENVVKSIISDEYGNIFKITGPAHIRFVDKIPQWYFECGSFLIYEFNCSLDLIEKYFRCM